MKKFFMFLFLFSIPAFLLLADQVMIKGKVANVRSSPDTQQKNIIAIVATGTQYPLADGTQTPGWYKIEINGKEGYVSRKVSFISTPTVSKPNITSTPTMSSTFTPTGSSTPTTTSTPVKNSSMVFPLAGDIIQGGHSLLGTGIPFNRDAGPVKLFPRNEAPTGINECHWVLIVISYIPTGGLGQKYQVQAPSEWSRVLQPRPTSTPLSYTMSDIRFHYFNETTYNLAISMAASGTPTTGWMDEKARAFNRYMVDRLWDSNSASQNGGSFYLDDFTKGKFGLKPGQEVFAIHEMYGENYAPFISPHSLPSEFKTVYWGLTQDYVDLTNAARVNGIVLFDPTNFFVAGDDVARRSQPGDRFRIEVYPISISSDRITVLASKNGDRTDLIPEIPSQTPTTTKTPIVRIASDNISAKLGVPIACDIVIPADFTWKAAVGVSLWDVQSTFRTWQGIRSIYASLAPRSDRLDSDWRFVNLVPALALFPDKSGSYNNPVFGFVQDPIQVLSDVILRIDTRSPFGRGLGLFDGDINLAYIPTYNKVYFGFSIELANEFLGNFNNLNSDINKGKYSTILPFSAVAANPIPGTQNAPDTGEPSGVSATPVSTAATVTPNSAVTTQSGGDVSNPVSTPNAIQTPQSQ